MIEVYKFFNNMYDSATTGKRNIVFNLGEMSCFNQHNAVEWIWIPFLL